MAIPTSGFGSTPVNPLGPYIQNLSRLGARVQQGSQVYFVARGAILGYAQSLTPNESYGTQNFYGVGAFGPQDIQPLQFSGSVSIRGGKLYVASWLGAGPGTNSPEGLYYAGQNMILSGDLSIGVFNAVTNTYDVMLNGCVAASYSATWQNGAFTMQTATFNYKNSAISPIGSTAVSTTTAATGGGAGGVQ